MLAAEQNSTHPIAKANFKYSNVQTQSLPAVEQQQEIPVYGIQAIVSGKQVMVGNEKLMESEQVSINGRPDNESGTIVRIAIDKEYKGSIVISDVIKEDAADTIDRLKKLGVKKTVMLSGDLDAVAQSESNMLHIDQLFGELLPEEKAKKLEKKIGRAHV